MENHTWEAWIGQRIERCESFPDGRTYVELEDGRGCIFGEPEAFLVRTGINPLDVAEVTIGGSK